MQPKNKINIMKFLLFFTVDVICNLLKKIKHPYMCVQGDKEANSANSVFWLILLSMKYIWDFYYLNFFFSCIIKPCRRTRRKVCIWKKAWIELFEYFFWFKYLNKNLEIKSLRQIEINKSEQRINEKRWCFFDNKKIKYTKIYTCIRNVIVDFSTILLNSFI